jgi:N-acetylmuramic acid 6-phosphate etherase
VTAPTEERNPDTVDIDTLGVLDVLRLINEADQRVPLAVAAVLPAVAAAVELAVRAVRTGGRVHYVGAGALRTARTRGAATVLVSANPSAPLASLVDMHIGVDTGPEVIAGSTRMKAATAQKLVLNAFSTAVMVRLGRTYSNLMIDMVPLNDKLRRRQVLLLQQATGLPSQRCARALEQAGGSARVALESLRLAE